MANSSATDSCIFCRIISGSLPARTVYETPDVLAFLDANPLAPGHTLVIPKGHHVRLTDMDQELATEVLTALYHVTEAVETAVEADATSIGFNNGRAAGQEVPHVHGHIIPRFMQDGGGPIHAVAGARPSLDDDELNTIAEAIRNESTTS